MKSFFIKLACLFIPMFLLRFFIKHKYVSPHQFPPSTLIHRFKARVLFEVEFNWYDHDLMPVSIVREVKSGKQFSVSYYELFEFKEFQGRDRAAGNSIDSYGKE